MAKRTRSNDQTNPAPTDPTAKPKPRARRARAAVPETPPRNAVPSQPDELPEIREPGDAADRAAQYEPETGPTEDDIRLRAYHRYLERGGTPGAAFDDWLEAERELRRQEQSNNNK
jgi:hypothetical protein